MISFRAFIEILVLERFMLILKNYQKIETSMEQDVFLYYSKQSVIAHSPLRAVNNS